MLASPASHPMAGAERKKMAQQWIFRNSNKKCHKNAKRNGGNIVAGGQQVRLDPLLPVGTPSRSFANLTHP